jgi:hypothetical protein
MGHRKILYKLLFYDSLVENSCQDHMEMKYYSLIKIAVISALFIFEFSLNIVLAEDSEQGFQIAKSDEVYSVPEDHGKAKQGKFYSERSDSILESGRLYLQVNVASYHPNEDDDENYNEFNPGVGLEYHFDDFYLAGGFFENSIDKTSTYWGVGHERTIGTNWFGLGLLGGIVTGYDSGFSPRIAAIPYMMFKTERVALKTYYVPAVGDVDSDAIGFAMRFDMNGLF